MIEGFAAAHSLAHQERDDDPNAKAMQEEALRRAVSLFGEHSFDLRD